MSKKDKEKDLEKKPCGCDETCECGCQEGKECTCDNVDCGCDCSCGGNCECDECDCSCDESCDCGCGCEHDNENKIMEVIADLQNKLMYKEAEFVNYRRRKDEEVANMLKYANQELILDVIKSVDNFERAILSIKKDDEKDNEKMLAGIEMIYNELVSTLKKYGVEEINEIDCKFDHNIHNAVMTDSVSDKENDIVLEILVKGYKLKDRVIRPAMVKVNNK